MTHERETTAIAIMVRVPSAEGKSRLSACMSAELRIELQKALLLDTLAVVQEVAGAAPYVAFCPPHGGPDMFSIIGHRAGLIAQQGRDLGERLQNAAGCLFHRHTRVILIGSDSPTIQPGHLRSAIHSLDTHGVCLGPAEDGGYYLIGLRGRMPSIFHGIDWGSESVLCQTTDILTAAAVKYQLLEPLYDIDTPKDLDRLRADLDQARAQTGIKLPERTLNFLNKMTASSKQGSDK